MIPPATAVGNPPTVPPENIYVPMPTSVPSVTAPAPAPVPPAPALATTRTPVPAPAPTPTSTILPPPTPMTKFPAPIPPRVSRELAHEGYVEMPGSTRGETRLLRDASREYAHHSRGLSLDHAGLVSKGWSYTRDCTPTRRLSGPADRTCVRPSYSDGRF